MIGRTLSHYKIIAELGRGGMGEVYRARDTKLKREVAIKVLPEEFARDQERLARFEREAQLLASLNHPNIASIYGIEDADGVKALVLELVEGPTLAERIAEGAIPVDEAIAIAKQIAEALEAAHGDGVIHRDLKPANAKVTEDGQVKVLDFGLAKALQGDVPSSTESELSQSPTLTRHGTAIGVILGTAAYMSPEQAKGKRVDRQTDVWAFGALLYEMLTGRRAFAGEDVSDTLAAVLRAQPDWNALPASTPETIRQVLRVCLAKDRKKRLQAMGDVRLAMEGAFEPSSPVTQRSWSRIAFAAALVLGGAIASVLVMSLGGSDSPPSPVVRFSVPLPESGGGPFSSTEVAISPDGSSIAIRTGNDIYLRPAGSLETTRLTDQGPARAPFFSDDGQWLGFFEQGQLKKVAVSGGSAPILLCDIDGSESGASWGDDDRIVFAQNPGGIYRVAGTGGEPEVLIASSEEEFVHFPQVLPGGDAVLFTSRGSSATTWEESKIVAHSLRTGERKVLIGGRAGLYAPTGHLIYSRDRTLFAVPFDLTNWEVGSGSVPLVETIPPYGSSASERNFSFSNSGALVFLTPGDLYSNRTPVWMSRHGDEEELELPPKPYNQVAISPDGTRVALDVVPGEENPDIWIYDLERETTTRFTFDEAADYAPIWTPDGKRIVFSSGRDGGGLYWKRSDGTGAVERLTSTSDGPRPYAYSVAPDGSRVVFNFRDPVSSYDIKTVTLDGEHIVEPLLETRFGERRASVAPDGRWIAYQTDESGENNIVVRPFPDLDGGKWQVSANGGWSPIWAPDGTALFFTQQQAVMRVDVETESTFTASVPELVFEGSFALGYRGYDVAPDGERFLMLKASGGYARDVQVVLNWFEELKERVPTGN